VKPPLPAVEAPALFVPPALVPAVTAVPPDAVVPPELGLLGDDVSEPPQLLKSRPPDARTRKMENLGTVEAMGVSVSA
jgi:hypothetical protein